ncbi:helix-turn-helix domain-containing protein [Pedobacter sp. HMF7647]|uniref:Helix-turn-helix domain-containing protein n=1 Tax=Hufsiella arboris TaxID=2695275 RepID=A0A7K1Y694_9SPHI|nr:helix-turn-helix domain-containing protein [Hufsiella arboris]MXV49960.1 helix-turn-helix domain-containing protein [Hufsiella arboris]
MYLLKKLIIAVVRIDTTLCQIHNLLIVYQQQQLSHLPVGDVWYDKQDVMQKLHISESTLLRLRRQGKLPYFRIKGKIYYRPADLDELLDKGASIV